MQTILIYDVSFPLAEQYDAIMPMVRSNLVVAALAMLIMAVMFIPHFGAHIVGTVSSMWVHVQVTAVRWRS